MESFASQSTWERPIVGVLIQNKLINQLLNQKPAQKLLLFQQVSQTAKITLYFFGMKNINVKRETISGTFFNLKKEAWEKKEFPYPDILYRRCSGAMKTRFHPFWNQVKQLQTKMINYSKGFNKWRVYQHLNKNNKLRAHIPLTKSYRSPRDLQKMLASCRKIYLKGHVGSKGKRIMQVRKIGHNHYQCRYHVGKLMVKQINSFYGLMRTIRFFFKNKRFMMQEAIDLITYDNGVADLRAHVQRNGKGQIEIIAIAVRVGQHHSPISTHGISYPFQTFFKDIQNYSKQEINDLQQTLERVIHTIYQTLEKRYGPCGEMGIDLGVDKKGKIWFIESNAKPLKVSIHKAYGMKVVEHSYLTILDYAKYLY